jgi:Caspase domain
MNMETEHIISRLITELGYTIDEAELTVKKLQSSTTEVQTAFNQWWEGKDPDLNLEVQGYTLKVLREDYGFNPVAALLIMDWLTRKPDEAARVLSEGYDVVYTSHQEEKHSENTKNVSHISTSPKRHGLLIGIDAASTMLPALRYAEADAQALANIFQQNGNFESVVLTGQAATAENISEAVAQFTRDRNENDTLMFYFAGHGVVTTSKDIRLLSYDPDERHNRGIDPEMLRSQIYESNAGQSLVILDCCYLGVVANLDQPRKTSHTDLKAFLQQLTESFEISRQEEGIFTRSLRVALIGATEQNTKKSMSDLILEILQGETESNPDKQEHQRTISLQEVYQYVADKMPNDMKPKLSGNVDKPLLLLTTS